MATVTAFIRVSTKKAEKATIRFRLSDGRVKQLFFTSEIEVDPTKWDAKTQEIVITFSPENTDGEHGDVSFVLLTVNRETRDDLM